MLVYASLYPIPTGFKTITEHRKMCVRDKTIFSNVLSIVKSSINYYSATYWILNLNLYKDSSVQSQCYIAVFDFIYIYICILLYTHTHIYIYKYDSLEWENIKKPHLISMTGSASKWCSNVIIETNIHFNHFSILSSLPVDNCSIFKHSFPSCTNEFWSR